MTMGMKIKYLFRGSAHGGAALINPPTPRGLGVRGRVGGQVAELQRLAKGGLLLVYGQGAGVVNPLRQFTPVCHFC